MSGSDHDHVANSGEPDQSVVSRGRVSWLTHPPSGVARVSVESNAFGHLPVSLPAHQPVPHEATPGELLAIAYGMFLAVAVSEDLLQAQTPANEIVVEAARENVPGQLEAVLESSG